MSFKSNSTDLVKAPDPIPRLSSGLDASGSVRANQAYYNAFAERYETERGANKPGGYHELVDELEANFVKKYGEGKKILEVGCGTGLLLERLSHFASSVHGVDISPAMLARARKRGFPVTEGAVTALPFAKEIFDVTCAFKVLPHVPELPQALTEMVRVTRPGGVVIAEFYNPYSLRALLKRWGPAKQVAPQVLEKDVYTRFDSPFKIWKQLPINCKWLGARGIRIVTPFAQLLEPHFVGRALRTLEGYLCDSPLRYAGGFFAIALQKTTDPTS